MGVCVCVRARARASMFYVDSKETESGTLSMNEMNTCIKKSVSLVVSLTSRFFFFFSAALSQ